MLKILKQFFQAFAALCSAFEKTAKAIDNIASAAERKSEDLLLETRLRRQEGKETSDVYIDESRIKRQARLRQLRATLETPENRVTHPIRHTSQALLTQTEPPPQRKGEHEVARIITAEVEVKQIRGRLPAIATGASPSHAQAIEYAETIEAAPIEHNRQLHSSPRRPQFNRLALQDCEARDIEERVAERGIKCLVHFTREVNLPSILQRGLVTRDVLRVSDQ